MGDPHFWLCRAQPMASPLGNVAGPEIVGAGRQGRAVINFFRRKALAIYTNPTPVQFPIQPLFCSPPCPSRDWTLAVLQS